MQIGGLKATSASQRLESWGFERLRIPKMQSASSDAGAGGFLGALSRPKFMLFASVVSSCLFYYIYIFFFYSRHYLWMVRRKLSDEAAVSPPCCAVVKPVRRIRARTRSVLLLELCTHGPAPPVETRGIHGVQSTGVSGSALATSSRPCDDHSRLAGSEAGGTCAALVGRRPTRAFVSTGQPNQLGGN